MDVITNCTIIGYQVPEANKSHTIRIGSGDIFLEIDRDGARIHGTSATDDVVKAFLDALAFVEINHFSTNIPSRTVQ